MNEKLKEKLRHLPDKPGCYIYRDRNGMIIYVGKAVSLRRRVQSYFRSSTLAKAPPKLRSLIHSIEDLETIVVRNEAEALLTEGKLIKDYKPRYNVLMRDDKRYLALCAESKLSCPRFSERRIIRQDGNEYFGPFPSSLVVHQVKDFLEKHFGIRKCKEVCPDEATHKHCLNDTIAFCSAPCINKISPEEYRARFEAACEFLRKGDPAVLSQLQESMEEAAAACDFERAAALRDTLFALRDMVKLRAREVATPSMKRDNALEGCARLQEVLHLPTLPRVIEGFDISHISGTLTVASMVVSVDGRPTPNRYRRFRIKTVEGIDDPRSMAEVIHRRYSRCIEENLPLPDLIMVDGGITQLRASREVLAGLGLGHVPTVGLAERFEELVLDNEYGDILQLSKSSPELQVLIRLRDEAHRFAITYNRDLRLKKIRESVLDEIPGVGESRKLTLLKHFGSVKRISEASEAELAAVVGPVLAKIIADYLGNDHQ
jgi:excinuclease ABC subunit C